MKLQTTVPPSLKLTYLHRRFYFLYDKWSQISFLLFLNFQEILSLHFPEMNFPKIVLVIILWNVMSGKRFSCRIMDQNAIDQLDYMILPSVVSL